MVTNARGCRQLVVRRMNKAKARPRMICVDEGSVVVRMTTSRVRQDEQRRDWLLTSKHDLDQNEDDDNCEDAL